MAGGLMRDADISKRLIAFTMAFLGRIKGGLGMVCVVSCTIFGAISGSASAAIAAIGSVMIPEMVEQGYSRGYATGLVAASSMLALLIPPSIPMIVFAMTAQISILAAFLSTLLPGVLMMTAYCIINLIMSRRMQSLKVAPKMPMPQTIAEIGRSTRHAGFALFMPVLVLGGIYGGVFTPTEAAGMSAVYAVLVGFFVYKKMTLKGVANNIKSSMVTSGVVMILLFFILMVSRIMVTYQVPQQLTEFIFSFTTNKWLVLMMLNVILLLMGMLVDDVSGNILSAAILLPIAKSVGIDPIHFAAISVTNLSLGNITPPCAPMLYLAGLIGGNLPLNEYVKPAACFMIFGAVPVILAVTYVPEFALILVNLFLK
jgi:tripartite ATP-independent transporter DctM subunit